MDEEDDDDDDMVLEEARVCIQESTTRDMAISLVRLHSCSFRELLDS